jgi:hypothetical protein
LSLSKEKKKKETRYLSSVFTRIHFFDMSTYFKR